MVKVSCVYCIVGVQICFSALALQVYFSFSCPLHQALVFIALFLIYIVCNDFHHHTLKTPTRLTFVSLCHILALPFGIASDTLATKDPDLEDEEEETRIFEKHDRLLHGERKERKYVG